MFKSARWRTDKNKVKAVFKLHFHATQVTELNSDALVVSVVPGDVGKPTARLEKGVVREGTCRWEYPIYETVRFTRDSRTGKINHRTYRFVVLSSGSAKSGYVGEATVDFADYAEAKKTSTISLPLKNSKSNGFLHVSIQRLQDNVDHGEVEETEDASIKSKDSILDTLLNNDEPDDGIKSHSNGDGPLINNTQNTEFIQRASSGSDMTMSSSGSSSGLNTPREVGLRNNNILQDSSSFLSSHSLLAAPLKQTENTSATTNGEHQQPKWGWLVDSDHGTTTDDSTISSQSILTGERPEESSDVEVEKLKAEIVVLARQVDLSELELQTLRKQIVKESKKGQDISKEFMSLKEERDALWAECEKFKSFQMRMEDAKSKSKLQFGGGDIQAILEELRQGLIYEKELNANLRLQLQKTQESNAELILAVKDLEELLESKSRELPDLSYKSISSENAVSRSESDDDEEQKALEVLVREHKDTKETYVLEQKIMDLCSEIEIYRRDKDELEMQMEQLALDYEILKQENHDMSYKLEQSRLQEQLKMQYECSASFVNITELEGKIENLENELKKQSEEYSESLATISKLETHIKSVEEEMENQAREFEADLEALMHGKVEQEQRAIRAEDALRKTRWKNANTAEKLQEEFKRLSIQMASTFDANEKVAMNALAEASELCLQKSQLKEMVKKAKEELHLVRDDHEAKLHELFDQLNLKAVQIEKMSAETDAKSRQLENQKKLEEQLVGALSEEILKLKAELNRLTVENKALSEQAEQRENMRAELEQMKLSVKQSEALVEKENANRNELVNTIALLKKETEKYIEELNQKKSSKSEEVTAMNLLQSEVEVLKSQCNDLKNSLLEDESEKEKLKKQVFHLKGELKKKEDAYTSIEKKLKESNRRTAVSDATKSTPKNQKSAQVLQASNEVTSLREKIKSLEGRISLKETASETSAKEMDLLNTIAELESRVKEFNQNSANFCNSTTNKIAEVATGIGSDSNTMTDNRGTDENLSATALMSKENGNALQLTKSDIVVSQELKISSVSNGDGHIDGMLSELASLRERNKTMESELKDMQERYSEISLKFAEVEGERQQLVMALRNLKNAKKS